MTGAVQGQAVLRDLRVLDLSQGPAGGLASMVLADFGAQVLKIEPPGGDRWRHMPSWPLWLRGKRSAVLDPANAADRESFSDLVQGSDVVLVSDTQEVLRRQGRDELSLCKLQPDLIYCSVTPWGETGALAQWPGSESLVAARSGRMQAFAGQQLREGPTYTGVPVATHAAAQGAVQGILAALTERIRGGARESAGGRRGARVETSLLQGFLPYDLVSLPMTQLIAREPQVYADLPVTGGGMPTLNYHPVLAGDGRWLQCGNLMEHLFYAFLDCTGLLQELLVEEQFADSPGAWSEATIEEARDRILLRLQEKSAGEWMEIFRAQGNVAIEPYLSAQEALQHPDLLGNGDVVTQDHPELGTLQMVGALAELTQTPAEIRRAAPAVGADSPVWEGASEVSCMSGERKPSPWQVSYQGALQSHQPLQGITILELGTIIATPLGCSMLADLGARVIKVEPLDGDPFREFGEGPVMGLMASKTNAGKESICVNLKSPEGRALVQNLAAQADVLVHNYRPGVPERLGIGFEDIQARNPRIVWVSANGYGRHSQGAHRPSAHPVPGAAMGGALYQAGSGQPQSQDRSIAGLRETARMLMRANEANPDPNTSCVLASAILLGVLAQQRDGVSQQIYLNMLCANAYANFDDMLSYRGKANRRPIDEECLGVSALCRLYQCREGWVFLDAEQDADWIKLCAGLETVDLSADAMALFRDKALGNMIARSARNAELITALEAVFVQRSASQWEAELIAAGVGCVQADANTVGEFYSGHEHALAQDLAPMVEHDQFGRIRRWGPLTRVNGGLQTYGPGVMAGADSDRILAELGHSSHAIAALRDDRIVA